jgi:hypothetical protein
MNSQYGKQLIKTLLIKSDLVQIDKALDEPIKDGMLQIVLIKSLFTTISNLVDFELTLRSYYKGTPVLSKIYKSTKNEFEFAKYMRNKYVGHIKDELIENAIEWRPELKYFYQKEHDDGLGYSYNLFILETLINTFVNNDGNHRIFDSDTDLIYPPDVTRFLNYMYNTAQNGIKFLNEVTKLLEEKVELQELVNADKNDWITAAKVDFKYIKK